MSNLNTRVAKWDNTKAILIFLVVLGHAITAFISDNEVTRSVFLWITAFHMPLFMFLTGLFSKSFVNAPKFNYNKIVSYVLLYFFMKLTIHLTLGIVRSWGKFRWTSEGGTPWYIFVTAVFMVLTYLLKNFNHKKVFIISIILALTVGYINEIGDTFMLSRIFVYYPYFFLGYMLDREKLLAFISKKSVRFISLAILVLFTIVIFALGDNIFSIRYALTGNNPYSEFGADWAPFGILLRMGCYTVSSLVGLSVLSLVPIKRIPVITRIGSKTLSVYALHRQVLYAFEYTLMVPMVALLPQNLILPALLLISALLTYVLSLKPFDYVLYPCTKCDRWLDPLTKWLAK